MDIVKLVSEFGFPVVMVVGLGYFVWFVWQTITNKIDPAIQDHTFDRCLTHVGSGHDPITAEN